MESFVSEKNDVWKDCRSSLEKILTEQQFDTWIRPLYAQLENNVLFLFAPNQFVKDYIEQNFLTKIKEALTQDISVEILIGGYESPPSLSAAEHKPSIKKSQRFQTNLNPFFTFDSFVEGKSNQLAKAAAQQVSLHYGTSYNPLFLYGAVGLGKTHLMQAVGNAMISKNPLLKVIYLHSERFVNGMIHALQTNTINDFKNQYRSLDALFIDDIQFFAGKDRSQEELFHIFNSLLESGKQMIFTCDRYPKEINGLEERLKSRFGWGLTVAIEPPELETRVAILLNKASKIGMSISSEVAFFIAKRIRSNVRELEGALKRVFACSQFTGKGITLELVKETLKDLIALQDRLITIENIQKTVADYFKIKVSDLLSKRRSRAVTRPRQIAMALAKSLTNHSLPEIGDAFGGRDHTTVLHACRVVEELKNASGVLSQDYQNLVRILST